MAYELDKIQGLYKEEDEVRKAFDKQIITSDELTSKLFVLKNEVRKLLNLPAIVAE